MPTGIMNVIQAYNMINVNIGRIIKTIADVRANSICIACCAVKLGIPDKYLTSGIDAARCLPVSPFALVVGGNIGSDRDDI